MDKMPKMLEPKTHHRHAKARNVSYLVKWDSKRGRFIVLNDKGVLLGLSRVRSLALGIARTAALNATRSQKIQVVVMVEESGKLKKQWTFDPPKTDV